MMLKAILLLKAAAVAAVGAVVIGSLAFAFSVLMTDLFVSRATQTFSESMERLRKRPEQPRRAVPDTDNQQSDRDLKIRQEELIRKELAWGEFFQPAANCNNPQTEAETVDCGNKYIRARRKFEASWTESR